jgi:endogenous inhibitor of DNA gyrase (YacG/DUF329 family)
MIEVEINGPDEKVYCDHDEVSSGKVGSGPHAFEIQEGRKIARYEVFIEYQKKRTSKSRHSYGGTITPGSGGTPVASLTVAAGAADFLAAGVANLLAKEITGIGLAITRNGEIVLNEGLPVKNIIQESAKKMSKVTPSVQESAEHGVCTSCRMEVSIPDCRYCPNCGSTLEFGPIASAFTWKDGNPDKPRFRLDEGRRQLNCIVCGKSLGQADLLAFCPFCGTGAHKADLIGWLQQNRTCPKCHQQINIQLLSRYLSSS